MAFTYSIVDSFSIAFLLILFFSTNDRSSRLTETRCFRMIVIFTITALLCDMVAWQLDGLPGDLPRALLWIANILCYILSGAMSLGWLYYTALKLNYVGRIPHSSKVLISLPCIFLVVMSLMTPFTHWLFYIDGANTYQRGILFAIQMVIPFSYILISAIWALYQASRERLLQQKEEYMALSSFIIFPLIGGVLQLAIYGVSLAWPCTSLSLMLVYVSMQNQKISLDALTGLNNRGQFDKHLYTCFERGENDMAFTLFMLDIDEFKRINDEFGHTEGDAALIDAANILKRALENSNAFLARYGGDEFAIVLYCRDDSETNALIERISRETEKHNSASGCQYNIVFSIGYVRYNKRRYSNYQDMITAADAQMYIEKRRHKAFASAKTN